MCDVRYSSRSALIIAFLLIIALCGCRHESGEKKVIESVKGFSVLDNTVYLNFDSQVSYSTKAQIAYEISSKLHYISISYVDSGSLNSFRVDISSRFENEFSLPDPRRCQVKLEGDQIDNKTVESICTAYYDFREYQLSLISGHDSVQHAMAVLTGVYFNIPEHYRIIKSEKELFWAKATYKSTVIQKCAIAGEIDSLFVPLELLADAHMVSIPIGGILDVSIERVKELRDSLMKLHWINELDSSRHIITRSIDRVQDVDIAMDGYKVDCFRGTWYVQDGLSAGAFNAYVISIPERNQSIYFEGIVTAPSQNKKQYFNELETIIRSTKILSK